MKTIGTNFVFASGGLFCKVKHCLQWAYRANSDVVDITFSSARTAPFITFLCVMNNPSYFRSSFNTLADLARHDPRAAQQVVRRQLLRDIGCFNDQIEAMKLNPEQLIMLVDPPENTNIPRLRCFVNSDKDLDLPQAVYHAYTDQDREGGETSVNTAYTAEKGASDGCFVPDSDLDWALRGMDTLAVGILLERAMIHLRIESAVLATSRYPGHSGNPMARKHAQLEDINSSGDVSTWPESKSDIGRPIHRYELPQEALTSDDALSVT